MAAGCGQGRRGNTPGSGKQRRRRRKKKVAGDTTERHARVKAEDGALRVMQTTSSDDQGDGPRNGDGAARRVCVVATDTDQDEVSGRGDGAVRQVRVALRDEDKMKRRQQSGDGGTWQAPAIPSAAEHEDESAVAATERVAAMTTDADVTGSMTTLTATVGKGNDRRVVIDTHAVLEALGVRNGGAPTQEELNAKVLDQLQAMMRMYGGDEAGDGNRSADGSPEALQAVLQGEQERRDERVANILMTKAQQQTTNEVQAREAERWQRRRQKRQERDKARRERRVERGRQEQEVVEGGAVQETAAAGAADAVPRANANHREGAVVVFKKDPTEEDKKLRETLDWSTRAARSLDQAKARVQSTKDGCAAFVVDDVGQCEKVTGENTVNKDAVREEVAQQLELVAKGLAINDTGAAAAVDKVELRRSRTRRRYEKRLRKALAKERRELGTLLTTCPYPKQAYYAFEEVHIRFGTAVPRVLSRSEAEAIGFMLPSATEVLQGRGGRRRSGRQYAYHSGSVYAHPYIERVGAKQRQVRVGRVRAVQAPVVDSLPTAVVEVRDERRRIKLDTGAQFSVAGEEWQALGERQDVLPPVDYVEGFTGAVSKVLGVWRFRFRTQYEQHMVVDALIVEGAATEFLLGEDWMLAKGVKIDFTACEMKWYEAETKKVVPFQCTKNGGMNDKLAKVRLVKRAKVQTQTCRNVELAVAAPEGTVGIFTPARRVEPHLLLAPTLTTVRGGKVVVPILNLVGRMSKLPSREVLGTWAPTAQDMTVLEMTGEFGRDKVKQWLDGWCTNVEPLSNEAALQLGEMSAEDKELLLKLLRNYPTLLEPRTGCPPMTTLDVEHEIHTGNEAPIKVRPRRHAHEEQKVIDEQVASMLNDGVIEPSSGAWGFPVVLVKKKDGSVRFCIDYRLLNAITKKDVYPLPRIDETLDNLHGARRFTSLDLHAGYWQVPVAAADRDKTGFVTRQGLFRFVRMPFGLANAPGTFQRMMDATLRGLTWQSCLVYLDDVIVFSKGGMGRHVVELAAVMERLASAGISLKASKCSFATERLEYLGHELDADGVRPMPSLVHSVQEFPVPTDVTELKRFVHMAGYYRRFVPDFARKAAPMTKLLRKGVVWRWAEPQQHAFESLKEALTSRPLLVYPDFSRPFKLVTDASKVGLGAALTQDQGQGEQPVAYASKINSPTVAKYSITDLECAAAVWAVKLFRPYIYGRKFELVTDHAALKWLMTSKDLTGRLHRWSLQLQEYNFEVVYRPGASNVVADALSRAPVRAVIGREEEAPPAGGEGQLTDETIRQEQADDKMVKNLRRKGKHGSKAIVVENEAVYIVLQDGSKRVVLPTALWASALRESHDSVYSCHLRTPQTYARIAATYWWPDMNDHVRRWVQACRDCGTRKAKAREVIPPLRSQGVGDPGDRWALDVAGPLPLTSGGNRYVIAAVDYATRYSVVAAVPNHTAKDVANFIAEKLVFVFGPMRELAMDGAPELNGKVIDALVEVLQAKQLTPVPYRPALLGLVERFHRTWKDMVSLYVSAAQDDWDRWLTCASYAYNGAKHSGTGFSPNELMMGRKLRAPNELLRQSGVTHVGDFAEYHRALVTGMARATRAARAALAKDQLRRERYYNRRVRRDTTFSMGDSVWVLKPPKGKGITKLAHQWVGPAKITQDAGFDNFEVVRDDTGEHLVVHCSFLVTSACPSDSLGSVAETILRELAEERGVDEDTEGDAGDDHEGTEALQRYEQRSTEPGVNAGTGMARAPDQNAATSTNSESAHRVSGGKDGGSAAARAPAARTTNDSVGSDGRSARRDAEGGGVTATGAVRASDDGSGGVPGAQQRPRIATGRRPEGASAPGDAAARPQLAVRDQGRKRKARASVAVEEEAARQQRLTKRRQGDAAREERAARRQAHRNEQAPTAAQVAGADADSGVHGGDDARQEGRDDEGRGASGRGDDGRGDAVRPGASQAGAGSSEVGGAEVEMLRGRGRPRRPEPMPALLQVATAGHIIERARRRVRNRAGRYVLEHEVEYAEQQGQPTARRWLSHEEFEELDDAEKIEGDLGAGDGV